MNIDRIKSNSTVKLNGCWEWNKSCNSAGYGQLSEDKQYWLAHRYAIACTTALVPEDVVRHVCHNTLCCNPEHLEIGTHKDNWQDSKDKHLASAAKRRKIWSIGEATYNTVKEAACKTGVSMNTITKYTVAGIFDIDAYRAGCIKARVAPRI